MTGPDAVPPAGGEAAAALPRAAGEADPAGAGTAAPGLRAQTHALRAAADFLDRHGVDGLVLTFHGDRVEVLVPSHLGDPRRRAAVVARLAAALGAPPTRHAVPRGWLTAAGRLAGHRLHTLTRLDTPGETTTP